MQPGQPIQHLILILLALSLLSASAEEKVLFDSLKLGDAVVRNVRVKDVTPTHVTVYHDGGGARLRRQDLPPELKTLYPYDTKAAAAYEKEQAALQDQRARETRARQDQANREVKASLQQQEQTAQTRLSELQRELQKLEREMGPMRAKAQGKRNSAARKELDAARDKKQDLIRRIEEQKDVLAKVRKQLQEVR
jgi:DNA anti-recombination protein RmuC